MRLVGYGRTNGTPAGNLRFEGTKGFTQGRTFSKLGFKPRSSDTKHLTLTNGVCNIFIEHNII